MANDLPRVTSIVVAVTLLARTTACAAPGGGRPEAAGPDAARVRMVEEQIAARGIADPRVRGEDGAHEGGICPSRLPAIPQRLYQPAALPERASTRSAAAGS
jgi:hypothetical protein